MRDAKGRFTKSDGKPETPRDGKGRFVKPVEFSMKALNGAHESLRQSSVDNSELNANTFGSDEYGIVHHIPPQSWTPKHCTNCGRTHSRDEGCKISLWSRFLRWLGGGEW